MFCTGVPSGKKCEVVPVLLMEAIVVLLLHFVLGEGPILELKDK